MNREAKTTTSTLRSFVKHVFRSLKSRHREYVFRSAVRQFISASGDLSPETATSLIYGWGNESWSAAHEYLVASAQSAMRCRTPILDCGSGLTTIILGVIAQKTGNTVWALEHQRFWGERVAQYLRRYHISSVRLHLTKLVDYGEFCWYSVPIELLPDNFSLVLCDGPPGQTRGGRYGLLPVMRSKLAPGAVILLDDAGRQQERDTAARWANELGTAYEVLGSTRPFVQIIVPRDSGNDPLGTTEVR